MSRANSRSRIGAISGSVIRRKIDHAVASSSAARSYSSAGQALPRDEQDDEALADREQAHDDDRRARVVRVREPLRRQHAPGGRVRRVAADAQEDVDRPVDRVEEPEPDEPVGDVRDHRRQHRGRPLGADAARPPVQQECERERGREPQRNGDRREHERVHQRVRKMSSPQSSRKLSSPTKAGVGDEVVLRQREPERDERRRATSTSSPRTYGASMSATWRRSLSVHGAPLPGRGVEEQRVLAPDRHAHLRTLRRTGLRGHVCDEPVLEVHVRLAPGHLDQVDTRRRRPPGRGGRAQAARPAPWPSGTPRRRAADAASRKFIAGVPRKRGDEAVGGLAVDLVRRPDLAHAALVHHGDAVAERHRLDLVVRDVQHRRADLAVEAAQLRPHLAPASRRRGSRAARRAGTRRAAARARARAPPAAARRRRAGTAAARATRSRRRARPPRRPAPAPRASPPRARRVRSRCSPRRSGAERARSSGTPSRRRAPRAGRS